MVIFPKEKPVIENINSFFVDIKRLLEHYQGEMVSGSVYFKSNTTQGAIFFDNNAVLSGVFNNGSAKLTGTEAIDRLITDCKDSNYSISVYEIDPARISYWANIPSAQRIYDNLSTDFTDLQGLMKKMGKEKLTGYIEVDMARTGKQAWVFFHNGMIIGGLDSWERSNLDRSGEYLKQLIGQTKNSDGTFHVCKVVMEQEIQPLQQNIQLHLQNLLAKFEEKMKSVNLNGADFEREFRKKMVDNADQFAFLDPFAGEFNYTNGNLSYDGDASDQELVQGTLTCVMELAQEKGVFDSFKQEMLQWLRKHGHGVKIKGLES
jgi:hypothetical protein